jgi:hypothetical protein
VARNQIRDVMFRPVAPVAGEGAGGHALFLTLELGDPTGLWSFLEDVVTRFKHERVTGPADARFMLITVIGDVSAADFAQAWQGAVANDAPARALLGMMQQADVMQGIAPDRLIGHASLLAS